MVMEWHGENPYYLLIVGTEYEGQHARVDLDEYQWATIWKDYLRIPGQWHLVRKRDDGVVLSVMIHNGDQGYYTSRVFGSTTTGDHLLRAYGIGKKQEEEPVLRLWVLENGLVCGGEDVDEFGILALHGGSS